MEIQIKLICKKVIFYSDMDENLFFEWIKNITAIIDCKGVIDEIHLYVKSANLDRSDLREINGLFKRYKIDRSQLHVFLNDTNQSWFKKFLNSK